MKESLGACAVTIQEPLEAHAFVSAFNPHHTVHTRGAPPRTRFGLAIVIKTVSLISPNDPCRYTTSPIMITCARTSYERRMTQEASTPMTLIKRDSLAHGSELSKPLCSGRVERLPEQMPAYCQWRRRRNISPLYYVVRLRPGKRSAVLTSAGFETCGARGAGERGQRRLAAS